MKRNSKIFVVLALNLFLNVFVLNNSSKVNAKEHIKVIDSLTIDNKKEQYYPGESIRLKGTWSIPDDSVDNAFKEGDTFTMSIPDGLTPDFKSINLSGFATGQVVGDKLVFTFTSNIEGLVDRMGGFSVLFKVDDPGEEGNHDIDINITDADGTDIIKELIVVNKPTAGDIGEMHEVFAKGKMSQTGDGLKWFVRINRDGSLKGNTTTFEDKLGPDHVLKPETLEVREHTDNNSETNITNSLDIDFENDLTGFQIKNLPLVGGYMGHRFYTLYYETEYVGSETTGKVNLKNTARLITDSQGIIYPPHNEGENSVVGELNLDSDGWGMGTVARSFRLRKIDSITKEPLANATFELSHKTDPNFTPIIFTTNELGLYEHTNKIKSGTYVLKELEAPDGYQVMEQQEIRISKENKDFEIEVENSLKKISVDVDKQWYDSDGKSIDSQSDITVALFANGKKIMQKILPKGQYNFSFSNLKQRDLDGNDLVYTIEELDIKGFSQEITGNIQTGFTIKNNADKLPIIPEPEIETISFEVSKEWIGEKLNSIDVDLLQNDTVIDTVSLSDLNDWKFMFNSLPKHDIDGSIINYSIKEHDYDNYTSTLTGSIQEGFIITNTEKELVVPNKAKMDIPVKKVWVGNPKDSIIVHLLRNDIKIDSLVLSSENNWQASFTNLDQKDSNNEDYIYNVQEEVLTGYVSVISGDMHNGFIITNTEIIKNPVIPDEPVESEVPKEVISENSSNSTTPITGINNSSIFYISIMLISIITSMILLKKKSYK